MFSVAQDYGDMSNHVKRAHIRELAKKEGVDEIRSWEQFWEALPHVRRLYDKCGDVRAAWGQYMDTFCRMRRPSTAWKPSADCIVVLVLTYLGIMDGSSDVERNFSQLALIECVRARRHHCEQLLQDILKVRLHAPAEFHEILLENAEWGKAVGRFLGAAQHKYSELFGQRQLASRSMVPMLLDVKRELFSKRRPRWQHMCQKAKNRKTQKVRRETWEEDVENMVKNAKTADGTPESFVDHIHISPSEKVMLQKAERVMRLKGVEYAFYQQEQEAAGALTAPPPLVQIRSLLDKPPQTKLRNGLGLAVCARMASARGAPRRKVSSASIVPRDVIVARGAATSTAVPPMWENVCIPMNMKVWFSPQAIKTQFASVAYLSRRGVLTKIEKESTHRIIGKGEKPGPEGGRALRIGVMVAELRTAAT